MSANVQTGTNLTLEFAFLCVDKAAFGDCALNLTSVSVTLDMSVPTAVYSANVMAIRIVPDRINWIAAYIAITTPLALSVKNVCRFSFVIPEVMENVYHVANIATAIPIFVFRKNWNRS